MPVGIGSEAKPQERGRMRQGLPSVRDLRSKDTFLGLSGGSPVEYMPGRWIPSQAPQNKTLPSASWHRALKSLPCLSPAAHSLARAHILLPLTHS